MWGVENCGQRSGTTGGESGNREFRSAELLRNTSGTIGLVQSAANECLSFIWFMDQN